MQSLNSIVDEEKLSFTISFNSSCNACFGFPDSNKLAPLTNHMIKIPIPHISTLSEYHNLFRISGAAYNWVVIWLRNTPENCESHGSI